jgi:hypothetical protein
MRYFESMTVIAAAAIGEVPLEAISRARWTASATCSRACPHVAVLQLIIEYLNSRLVIAAT